MHEDERTNLEQQIAFNEKKQGLYIMRASKTILSILQRGSDKIKQGGRVMVLDEKSAEKLCPRIDLFSSFIDLSRLASSILFALSYSSSKSITSKSITLLMTFVK